MSGRQAAYSTPTKVAPDLPGGADGKAADPPRRNRLTPVMKKEAFGGEDLEARVAEYDPDSDSDAEREEREKKAKENQLWAVPEPPEFGEPGCIPGLDEPTRETPEYGGLRCIFITVGFMLNVGFVAGLKAAFTVTENVVGEELCDYGTEELYIGKCMPKGGSLDMCVGNGGAAVPVDVYSNVNELTYMWPPLVVTTLLGIAMLWFFITGRLVAMRMVELPTAVAQLKIGSSVLTIFTLTFTIITAVFYTSRVLKLQARAFVSMTLPASSAMSPWTEGAHYPKAVELLEADHPDATRLSCARNEQLLRLDFSTPDGFSGVPGDCYRQLARGQYEDGIRVCDITKSTFEEGIQTVCCVSARASGETIRSIVNGLQIIIAAYVGTFIVNFIFDAVNLCLSISLIVIR